LFPKATPDTDFTDATDYTEKTDSCAMLSSLLTRYVPKASPGAPSQLFFPSV
jgi:hypothetical protein